MLSLANATRTLAQRFGSNPGFSALRSMSSINYIQSPNAPAAIGPYSQGVEVNGTIYVSGVLGLDPKSGEFPSDDVEEQTEQVMANMKAVLEAADANLNNVAKTTILLASMDDFAKVNTIYSKHFGDHRPARACFAVKTLPKNALVEIEAIAVK